MSSNNYDAANNCDTILDLISDYAFGLTDPEDTRLVESGLPACPDAAAELAAYRRLQDEMRANVSQIDPAPQLIEQLMASISTSEKPVTARRRLLHPAWLAAVAAILVLLVTNIYWLMRVEDLVRRQDELVSQFPVSETGAFVLTGTANLRWVRLPGPQENADRSAFLMWNAESKIGLMYARGLPQLPPGRTYQLWLTRGEERASVGTFEVDEEGNGALLFESVKPIDEFTWARITDEPAKGSTEPTGQMIVNGEL
jgi:hypothetical protein